MLITQNTMFIFSHCNSNLQQSQNLYIQQVEDRKIIGQKGLGQGKALNKNRG